VGSQVRVVSIMILTPMLRRFDCLEACRRRPARVVGLRRALALPPWQSGGVAWRCRAGTRVLPAEYAKRLRAGDAAKP
ncbi:MAG TPA: hypothetical protein VJX66_12200, partial [Amycolatopsis sp.]|nr:hypothetical protein [Amycolatopsis sp.]